MPNKRAIEAIKKRVCISPFPSLLLRCFCLLMCDVVQEAGFHSPSAELHRLKTQERWYSNSKHLKTVLTCPVWFGISCSTEAAQTCRPGRENLRSSRKSFLSQNGQYTPDASDNIQQIPTVALRSDNIQQIPTVALRSLRVSKISKIRRNHT